MEERSLRVVGTDKTFFNKLTNTLTKILIPTQIGINGMRISMKRNAVIKAYEIAEEEEDVNKKENADKKLSVFKDLPIKHKCITAQPLLEKINIKKYLDGVELVVVGGESDANARPLDYTWVLDVREQCIRRNVSFEFRQCGTHFIKDGKEYRLQTKDLCAQARKADIDFKPNN